MSKALRSVALTLFFPLFLCLAVNLWPQFSTAQLTIESEQQIKQLIADLGNADFKTREEASKQLEKIGVPALEALQDAENANDAEVQKRVAELVARIRLTHHLPTWVKGVEFSLCLNSKEWSIENDKKSVDVGEIQLKITNRSALAYTFDLRGTKLVLRDAKQVKLKEKQLGRKTDKDGVIFTGSLATNETFLFDYCHGTFSLIGKKSALTLKEPTTNSFGFFDLPKGTYYLSIDYMNSNTKMQDGSLLWTGQVETPREELILSWKD